MEGVNHVRLSDMIESFIKDMMSPQEGELRLQRNELAEHFSCSPSQINYVLSTRFTPAHGYLIESRRGGGGFIRIVQIRTQTGEQLEQILNELIGDAIDAHSAQAICRQLANREVITKSEANIMCAATASRAFNAEANNRIKDEIRAGVLRSMLISVVKGNEQEDKNDL
ncbi:MAG: CtsR family transcriptional regulator [Eubacteriales bacterium]|nr:CtsR family transcriptional regulator [Eubacteriales bacterium]